MKIVLLILSFGLATGCFSQVLPLDPAVKVGTLANGFTYYIRNNQEPAKRVQFYLVNKVGSILERDDQRGLAHFMEHMSFNGTTHFPKNQLVEYLQKSGVRFGADLNAYTSFDETVYQLPLPADDPKLLQNGLQIMRDWAQEATLDLKEIDAERGVVLEEKRLGKGAGERMREKTFPVLLNNSRYADRLPIGTEDVLKTFSKQSILDFYKDWYRPDLQALIVVGDIDVEKIEAQIKSLFSDLVMPANPKPRTNYEVPLTGNNQFIAVTDKENPNTVLQLFIKQKATEVKTQTDYEELIRRSLFNQLLAGRVGELSQKPNPPFLRATAAMEGLLGGLDAFTVTVIAKPGELEKATKLVYAEVQRVKQFGFSQSELDRAKISYLNYFESILKEKDKRNSANLVNEYTRLFLKEEASPGIEMEFELTRNFLPALELTDINVMASKYITDTNRDIVIMAPEKDKEKLPTASIVDNWLQQASTNLTAYMDDFKGGDLLPLLPPAGKVTQEKKITSVGITELTLSNGVKVLCKPTKFKNEEIQFNVFSPGGTSLYGIGDYESAANAANIVAASGLGNFPPADFPKLLSGKQVNLQPYIAERSEGISGVTTPKDLETSLQLVHLYFTAPRRDTVVFNNIIARSASAIGSRHDDPNNVFADTVASVLGNHSSRRTGPSLEKLKQINFDKVFSIYKERFANAGEFTFIIVGNFNPDTLKLLLERYIGSLPFAKGKEKAKDLGIHIPGGKNKIIVRKGSEEKAMVRLVISGDYQYSATNNTQLSALGEILQFKITERLREKEGGAYSPSVSTSYSKLPRNRYSFTINFGCAPANVEKLIVAAKQEIAKLQLTSIGATDITKFVSEQTRQHELQLQSNRFWLSYLGSQTENGEDPTAVLHYKNLLKQVTPGSVKLAAKKYLNGSNLIELILLPDSSLQ